MTRHRTKGQANQWWSVNGMTMSSTNSYTTLVKAKYHRYRITEEYGRDTAAADEEPNAIDYLVSLDSYWGQRSYPQRLTWERWCRIISPDGDIESALSLLRSLTHKQYRLLESKGGRHILVLESRDGAVETAMMFCERLGEDVLG